MEQVMADKAYAILLNAEDNDNGYLYFPFKRAGREYGRMPQFFGGTKNEGESDRDTIARELAEESDNKVTLQSGGLTKIHSAKVDTDNYSFYVAINFTGSQFLGPLNNPEMAKIEKYLVQIGQRDDIGDLLKFFSVVPTLPFSESETYKAFDKAIAWSQTSDDKRTSD
jgi:hypothetical protein